MTEYLTPEQRMALENQLADGEEMLDEHQARKAFRQGMRMAQADRMLGRGAQAMEEGGEDWADGQQDEEMDVFVLDGEDKAFCKAHGYRSMKDIRWGFQVLHELVDAQRELIHDMEAESEAFDQKMRAPRYALRRRVRMELRPMRTKAQELARNRMIQQDWMASAGEMYDLEKLMPEMAEYIMENPRFSEDSEGLMRAYQAVRSRKYRGEDELLNDSRFVERMAGDERVKAAVLRAHLEEIRRGGRIPQVIGAAQEAGKTPLSARKPITGMEQAKKRLEAMLAR